MNRKTGLFCLIFSLTLLASPLFSSDGIDNLIDQSNEEKKEWLSVDEEVPPAYLVGNRNSILLYHPEADGSDGNSICGPMEIEALLGLNRAKVEHGDTIINVDLPVVRELFSETCLVRPGDMFVAVGPDKRTRVRIKNFVVRRSKEKFNTKAVPALWGDLEIPLDADPLFFSNYEDVSAGEGELQPIVEKKVSGIHPVFSANLSTKFLNPIDFDVFSCSTGTSAPLGMVVVRRKIVTPDDDDLPNEMVLVENDGVWQEVWVERGNSKMGSGTLKPLGWLDFNHDGIFDLIIQGVHENCPYIMVFKGGGDQIYLPIVLKWLI